MRRRDVILLSPHEMAERFAAREPLDDEPELESWDYERDVEPYLEMLRPALADTVELYYLRALSQARVAYILGITQEAVLYRLRRARARLRLYQSLPHVSAAKAREDLRHLLTPEQVRVFLAVTRLHSSRRAALELRLKGRTVRARWTRIRALIEASTLTTYQTLAAAAPRKKARP